MNKLSQIEMNSKKSFFVKQWTVSTCVGDAFHSLISDDLLKNRLLV